MKKLLLITLVTLPLYVFAEKATEKQPAKPANPAAAESAKDADRTPASEQELVASRLRTADVLSRARLQNQTCEMDAYQTEILEEVNKVQCRTGFSVNQISQSVRQALAGVIAFNEITSNVSLSSSNSQADWERALTNSYWESIGQGVYGPQYKLTLKAGGRIEVQRMEVLDNEPWWKVHSEVGQWGVQKRAERGSRDAVVRVWFKLNNKTRAYRLEKNYENQGMWQLNKGTKTGSERRAEFFNYSANECEA